MCRLLFGLVYCCLFLLASDLASAQVLYGTTGSSYYNGTDMLVRIDPDTGNLLEEIGPIGYEVNGLTFDESGVLYASTSANSNFNGLITIDLTTGAGTPVNIAAEGWGNINNLTADSAGNLYGYDRSTYNLVSIDKTTGIDTPVGYSGYGWGRHGMSFDNTDNLFVIQHDRIYSIDASTGVVTYVGSISGARDYAHHGDFNPTNNLYYGIDHTYDPRSLRVIDVATRTLENILPTVNGLHTLAFVNKEDLDDDGVLNAGDNCIATYNPDQADEDGDNAGNVCDNCPDIYNPDQDEEAACITLAAAGASCMESQIQLTNDPGSVFGFVGLNSLETLVSDYTQDEYGDQISENLKIARGWRRGVFNAGTDEIAWALGTFGAETTPWYDDFELFLQDEIVYQPAAACYGPDYLCLPGQDTVLHNVTTGEYYNVHWDSWSRDGYGGFAYTRVHTTTLDTVNYVEADGNPLAPQTVDQISPSLGLRRGGSGGLYNVNTDQTRWALGTVAGGATSTWYTSHSLFLQNEIRPLNGYAGNHLNLPGKDTILHNATTDEYYDIHWNYWSQGGSGGFSYTRTNVDRTLVTSEAFSDSTLPGSIDISALQSGEYEFCVSGQEFVPPTTVTFEQPAQGDQISENLLIYRPNTGPLQSIGTDQIRWATGTAAGPTSGWYSQFWELLRYQVRYNSSSPYCYGPNSTCLPSTPVVLHNVTTDQFYDLDFHYWTAGGDTFSYTRVESVTGDTVLYDESQTVDVITPQLRITRDATRGVYNLGVHQVLWAAGTTAAPTTAFMDFETLLRTHFRNLPGDVPGSLPGSATVLWDVVDNTYYDVTWLSWGSGRTDGQRGGFSYTRTGPYIADRPPQDCTIFTKTTEDTIVINGTCNQPPTVSLSGPTPVNEGDTATYNFTVVDPDAGDTFSVGSGPDCGIGGSFVAGSLSVNASGGSFQCLFPNGPANSTPSIQVTDSAGAPSNLAEFVVNVVNVAPTITEVNGPTDPIALGDPADISVSYTDPGVLDTHTCTFEWDDAVGTPTNQPGSGSGGAGSCTDTFNFTEAGVYTVSVTVTDNNGGFDSAVFEFVVVYDPSAGFVTGGGQIQSAPGSYRPDEALEGVAHFGFVSKYKKGADTPTGETEFQFQVADFNFHSTSYDWLVIAGNKAQYKGEGRVTGPLDPNGEGVYGFLLTATDGDAKNGGDGLDKFRIKIWDKSAGDVVVYDNKQGSSDDIDDADPQAILHGSIVVHTKGNK